MEVAAAPLERRGTFFVACYVLMALPTTIAVLALALALFSTLVMAPLAIEILLRLYDFAIVADVNVRYRPPLTGAWAIAVLANTIVLSPVLCAVLLAGVVLVVSLALLLGPFLLAIAAATRLRDDLNFYEEFQYSYLQAIRYSCSLTLWSLFPSYEPGVILFAPSKTDNVPEASWFARWIDRLGAPAADSASKARARMPSEDAALRHAAEVSGQVVVANAEHVVIVNGRRLPNGTPVVPGLVLPTDEDRGHRHVFFWPCFVLAGAPALLILTALGTALFFSGLFFPFGVEALLRLLHYALPANVGYTDRPLLTGAWRRLVIANFALLSPLLFVVALVAAGVVGVCAILFYPLMLMWALCSPVDVATDFFTEFHRGYRQALRFLAGVVRWTLVPFVDPLRHLTDRERAVRVSARRTPSRDFTTPPPDVVRRVPQAQPRFSVGAAYAQLLRAIALGRAVRVKMPSVRRGKFFVACYAVSGAPVLLLLALVNLVLVCSGVFLPLGTESLIRIVSYGFAGDINFFSRPRLSGVWGSLVLAGAILLAPLQFALWCTCFVTLGALAVVMFPAMVLFAACVPIPDDFDFVVEFAYSYKQALRFTQIMIVWVLVPSYSPAAVSGKRVTFRKADPATQHLYNSSQASYTEGTEQPSVPNSVIPEDDDDEDDTVEDDSDERGDETDTDLDEEDGGNGDEEDGDSEHEDDDADDDQEESYEVSESRTDHLDDDESLNTISTYAMDGASGAPAAAAWESATGRPAWAAAASSVTTLPDGRTIRWTTVDADRATRPAQALDPAMHTYSGNSSVAASLNFDAVGPMMLLPDGRLIETAGAGSRERPVVPDGQSLGTITHSSLSLPSDADYSNSHSSPGSPSRATRFQGHPGLL